MNESGTIGKAHHTMFKACDIPHAFLISRMLSQYT